MCESTKNSIKDLNDRKDNETEIYLFFKLPEFQ